MDEGNKTVWPLMFVVYVIPFGQRRSFVFVLVKVAADCPLESAARPEPTIADLCVNTPQQWGQRIAEFLFYLSECSSAYRGWKSRRWVHVVAPVRIGRACRHQCKNRVVVHARLVEASELVIVLTDLIVPEHYSVCNLSRWGGRGLLFANRL